MSKISTQVLDTASGRPTAGLHVTLEHWTGTDWREITEGDTDQDGRRLLVDTPVAAGTYRLIFATGRYLPRPAFLPRVIVEFTVHDPQQAHHVTLALSPYGYAAYRGG